MKTLQLFDFIHVTAQESAEHVQQEAAVLVLRKYHKAEISTCVTGISSLSLLKLGPQTRKWQTFFLFSVVLRSESKIWARKLTFGKRGWEVSYLSCPHPLHNMSTQTCHSLLEEGPCRPGGFYQCAAFQTQCKVLSFKWAVISPVTFVLHPSISYGGIFLVIS